MVCARRPTTLHETLGATVGNRQLPRLQIQRRLVRTQPAKKELERRIRLRSPQKRAIKGGSHSNQPCSNSNTLAIRDQPSGKGTKNKGGRKGKGAGKGDKGKKSSYSHTGDSSGSAYTRGSRSRFDELTSPRTELHIRRLLLYLSVQQVQGQECNRYHACAGCDKANTPHVDCLCLEGVPL